MKAQRGSRGLVPHFIEKRCGCTTSPSSRFDPWKKLCPNGTGGLVGRIDGQDECGKSPPHQNSNARPPYRCRYTNSRFIYKKPTI